MPLGQFAPRLHAIAATALLIAAIVCSADQGWARSSIFVGANADSALDLTGLSTVEDMTGASGDQRFTPSDGKRPANYGANNGPTAAMWLRLIVPTELSTAGGLVILTVREPRIQTLDVYWSRDGGYAVRRWRLGEEMDNARLPTRYPSIALPESVRGQTIFIRLHTPSSMRASVWVQNEHSYLRTYAAEMIFFGLLFGVLLALLVYLASAAVGSRDEATGALALLALCFTLHILGDQAFLETYFFPGATEASRAVSITATFCIYAVSLFYATQALYTDRYFPRAGRILRACVWVLIALTVAAAVTTTFGVLTLRRLSPVIGLVTISTILGLMLATATMERWRAVIFGLCWGPALATGIARLLPDLAPQDGFNPTLINLLYPAFVTSLLLAGIAAARDIRNRENALTQAVANNAERLQAFAESASDSFWETDAGGRIVFASGPACGTAGFSVGATLQAVTAKDAHVRLTPGAPLSRVPLLRDDGDREQRHLRLSAVPIAGGGWRGIISDVTDEVVEAERTNRQRRMAAIGQMAGGVAHEINNLLYPVINLSRRAGEGFEEGDERRSWLEIVRASGMRAAEIVAALLSSVRPIPGGGKRAPMGAALNEIAAEVRALVPASTPLETRIDTEDGPIVPVSEVFQVVANLVTNAVHATSGGAVTLTYSLVERTQAPVFELAVSDDGVGMDEATLSRAFEPFFTTKPQSEGTGLGLSIVHGLASKWGGELKIASSLGKGTKVTVSVPQGQRTPEGEVPSEGSRS